MTQQSILQCCKYVIFLYGLHKQLFHKMYFDKINLTLTVNNSCSYNSWHSSSQHLVKSVIAFKIINSTCFPKIYLLLPYYLNRQIHYFSYLIFLAFPFLPFIHISYTSSSIVCLCHLLSCV